MEPTSKAIYILSWFGCAVILAAVVCFGFWSFSAGEPRTFIFYAITHCREILVCVLVFVGVSLPLGIALLTQGMLTIWLLEHARREFGKKTERDGMP